MAITHIDPNDVVKAADFVYEWLKDNGNNKPGLWEHESIPLSDIAQHINNDVEYTESVLVDAIEKQIIAGRIDQKRNLLKVCFAESSQYKNDYFDTLKLRLEDFQSRVITPLLKTVKGIEEGSNI